MERGGKVASHSSLENSKNNWKFKKKLENFEKIGKN